MNENHPYLLTMLKVCLSSKQEFKLVSIPEKLEQNNTHNIFLVILAHSTCLPSISQKTRPTGRKQDYHSSF